MQTGDHKNNESAKPNGGAGTRFPPWLITYSDLITLLLTFFILLMSMAEFDPVRFNEAANSLKGAFGLRPEPAGNEVIVPVFPSPPVSDTAPNLKAAINRIYQDLKLDIENSENFSEVIRTMQPDSNTLLVRIGAPLLFEPGKDVLLPSAYPFLDKVARSIKDYPIDIRIEGHTDDIEANADPHANNWELSTARAISVMRYFVQQRLIPIERLSAVGYGSQQPVVKNSTEANRLLNRRVDLLLQANFTSGTTPANRPRSPLPL